MVPEGQKEVWIFNLFEDVTKLLINKQMFKYKCIKERNSQKGERSVLEGRSEEREKKRWGEVEEESEKNGEGVGACVMEKLRNNKISQKNIQVIEMEIIASLNVTALPNYVK